MVNAKRYALLNFLNFANFFDQKVSYNQKFLENLDFL